MKKDIKKITIDINSKILSALKKMDEIDRKLLLVTENDLFKSLISIGDIQRAIIKNTDLNTPIKNILRKNVKVAFENDDFETVKERMYVNRNEFMPILTKEKKISQVVFWEDLFKTGIHDTSPDINIPVVIMAGGKGIRLKPITNVLPKPLIPIGEKTIIEEILNKFLNVGCKHFYLSVNYKAEMIKYYFEQKQNVDYRIEYVQEEKPLGTAGSLYLLKNKINETFFVSNCDILINQDFSEIYNYHKENKNVITIVAALKHYKIPYGTLSTKVGGLLETIEEKPELTFKINSGLYILEPEMLNEIPENTFFHITELIEKVKNKNSKVGVFPVSEGSWKDIGEWGEYIKNSGIK